jgi:hypothetical protein
MVFVVAVTLCLPLSVFANDSAETSKIELTEQEKLLLDAGFSESTLEALSDSDVSDIATAIAADPSKVDIQTVTQEFDQLAEIEAFVSCTDAELLATGANLENIKVARDQIETMYKKSNNELVAEYGISKIEAKLFDKAIEHGWASREENTIDTKESISDITTSGSIASSKFTLTQSIVSNSYPVPDYTVTLSYSWKSPYGTTIYDDKLCATWTNGLLSKNISGTANYHQFTGSGADIASSGTWGSKLNSKNLAYAKSSTYGFLTFNIPQSNGNFLIGNRLIGKGLTKTGSAKFTLYKTSKKEWGTGYVVSRYLHRTSRIQSVQYSLAPGNIAVGVPSSYDYSSQPCSYFIY